MKRPSKPTRAAWLTSGLIGFQLLVPGSSVTSCTVQSPMFRSTAQYFVDLTISQAASSYWDEDTVDGENAPDSQDPFTKIHVRPDHTNLKPIDITPACQGAASDGQFSIYVATEFGSLKDIESKDSGNPAISRITYA